MKKKIHKILIICTGNTCRSPAGAFLAQYHAKEKGVDLIFDSAGFINAFSYMQPESQDFLNSKGIDHSNFKPKIINLSLLKKQDLIITMEEHHSNQIKDNFSSIQDIDKKVFTLKEFNGSKSDLDVIDPYYTDNRTYVKIMKEIDENIEKMVEKIIKFNENNK